jgi:hypothetical protein
MISEEKIAETRRLLKKGEPEGEIREKLRAEGCTEEDISKVFVPHKYDMRSWYLTFAIIITIAGIIILARTGGLLILILGGLLFLAYSQELKRIEKQR